MNCNRFMTCILRTKSNIIFHNILELGPSLCRSKLLIRTDLRKALCSYFISANNCYTIHRKVCRTVIQDDSSLLATKLKFPFHLSACSYHLSFLLNNADKNADKLNNETKATEEKSAGDDAHPDSEKKLTRIQEFKLMYKQYWYVLIPVHVATSLVWYGTFFFAAKSGVDIVPILEKLGITEKFLQYMRESNAGYYGIAYAMYKLATPARYTVTLGGTTLAINYLKNRGYIKPIPSKREIQVMIEDKKDELKERREEMREMYHEKRDEFFDKYHDKREEFFDKYHDKKDEMRDKYNDRRNKFFNRYGVSKMDKDEPNKDQSNSSKINKEDEKKR